MKASIIAMSLGVIVGVLQIGCGGRSADEVVSDAKGQTAEEAVRENKVAEKMQGVWTSECHASSSPNAGTHLLSIPANYSAKSEYNFEGNSFRYTQFFYSDTECKELAATVNQKGKLERVGDAGPDENSQAIDFKFEQANIVTNNDEGNNWFRLRNVCGINDWNLQQEKDVTGASGKFSCPVDKAGKTTYDRILIEGNRLFLGSNASNENANERPTLEQINRDFPFIKK